MSTKSLERYLAQIVEAIRAARYDQGTTQEEVAHEAGLSVRGFARLESGRTNPIVATLFDVAEALDTTPAAFLQVVAG